MQDFGYVTNSYIVSGGWSRDTRNDILYPTFGRLQSALVEVGLPFGDLSYYKLQYVNQSFWPVYGDFVLMLRGDLGYGDGYSGKPLPFFKAFYAGGVGFGARLRERARSGRATSTAMRWAASARSSATRRCSIRSSRASGRCASRRSATRARST